MLVKLFILAISVAVVALPYARWEYRKHGKLTLIGLLLLCTMLFLPNLMLEYATNYQLPGTALDYVGVFIGLVGIVLCLLGITYFRSYAKMLCMDTGVLTIKSTCIVCSANNTPSSAAKLHVTLVGDIPIHLNHHSIRRGNRLPSRHRHVLTAHTVYAYSPSSCRHHALPMEAPGWTQVTATFVCCVAALPSAGRINYG